MLTYAEWLEFVFDHPVEEHLPAWHGDDAWNDFWRADWYPVETVNYITRCFEEIETATAPYTDAQINQALWFILSNGLSDYMFALIDPNVPLDARLRCIRAFYTVFERLYAPRCTPILSHAIRAAAYPAEVNPLNSSCYMWWDLLPIAGPPADTQGEAMNATMLDVLEATLALDSVACQEGALHGLGHWHGPDRARAEAIVDAYLAANPDLMPELAAYAQAARGGCIL